jgi:hypothetical protein
VGGLIGLVHSKEADCRKAGKDDRAEGLRPSKKRFHGWYVQG